MEEYIKLDKEFAKNILQVLKNHTSLCYAIISIDVKEKVSEEAYEKLYELFMKYHNANCGPFNRALDIAIKNNQFDLEDLKERIRCLKTDRLWDTDKQVDDILKLLE